MANEKNVNKGKESWLVRTGRWFKRLPNRIATPFKNTWHDLKKVTWPTKKEWVNSVIIVIVFMVFMGIVIGLLDGGSTALVQWIMSL